MTQKQEYDKSFKMMQDIIDSYDLEIQILCNRLYFLKKFLKKWGRTNANGRQIVVPYKCVDIMNNIINGNINEDYLKD